MTEEQVIEFLQKNNYRVFFHDQNDMASNPVAVEDATFASELVAEL